MTIIVIAITNVCRNTKYILLHKHDIGGISLSGVKGRGKIPHTAIPEVISGEWHMTGKRIVPEYVGRARISVVMQESKIKSLLQDLRKISLERGKVFVLDVPEAYDLVSGAEGENAL